MVLFAAYPSVSVAVQEWQCDPELVRYCVEIGGILNTNNCTCKERIEPTEPGDHLDVCDDIDTQISCQANGGTYDYTKCTCNCGRELAEACNGILDFTCECIESDEPGTSGNNCEPVPDCSAIGFAYTSAECGSLKKLKCPFDDRSYFCSKSDCNQVTYNSTTQYCTKYCADTPSMCVEAKYKTCDTTADTGLFALNNGVVGTLHKANTKISSSYNNIITGSHYLLGPVTLDSSAYMQNVHIYNAGQEYPNNCASSMNGKPSLSSNYLYLTGDNIFRADITFNNVPYNSSNPWSAQFYGNTNIKIKFTPHPSYPNTINLTLQGEGTDNKICIDLDNSMCRENGSLFPDGTCVGFPSHEFNASIRAIRANVKYDVMGGNSNYVHVNCNPINGGSCTQTSNACYF